jgi:hypothetical protein
MVFAKTYTTNTSETAIFQAPSGATGNVPVVISTIVTGGSLGAQVKYAPAQAASGNVEVTVRLTTTGGVAPAHWVLSGTKEYVRTYTGSVHQQELTFSDIAGNTIEVLIDLTIDKDAPVATTLSYDPNTTTNSGVKVTLTTNEAVLLPDGWSGPATGTAFTKIYTDNT